MTITRELRMTLMIGAIVFAASAAVLLVFQWRELKRIERIVRTSLPVSTAAFEMEVASAEQLVSSLAFAASGDIDRLPRQFLHNRDFRSIAERVVDQTGTVEQRLVIEEALGEFDRLESQLTLLRESLDADIDHLRTDAGARQLAGILATRKRIDDQLRHDLQQHVIRELGSIDRTLRLEVTGATIALGILLLLIPLLFYRISFLVHRRITNPVHQIEVALDQFAQGDSAARVSTGRNDEIGSVARKINLALDLIQRQSITKMRLREIVNAIATFVVAVDAQGHITFANERFNDLLFRSEIDPAATKMLELLPTEIRAPIARAMAQNELPVELTTTLMAHDRSIMPIRLVVTPIHSVGDDRFLFVGEDISEWAMMQHRLSSSEQERDMIRSALSTSEARARELEWSMLDIAEREQRRIGRDLHDDLGQRLTGIAFLAKVLGQRTGMLAPELTESTEWIVTLINHAIDDVRRVSRELNPVGFEETDLAVALQRLAADVRRACGISCEFVNQGVAGDIRGRMALNIYRIVQESTSNAMRHGRAATITILMERRRSGLRLAVLDDGAGFDARRVRGGSGLANIRTRALALGGRARCRSGPDGTLVLVHLPYCGDAVAH